MITVIIPTRNRSVLLAVALASLEKQQFPRAGLEVLVIDNDSADQKQQVIAEFQAILPNLNGIHEPQPGLHAGRYAGMRAAKGDIFIFAHDDIEALPTLLARIERCVCRFGHCYGGRQQLSAIFGRAARLVNKTLEEPSLPGYEAIPSLRPESVTRFG